MHLSYKKTHFVKAHHKKRLTTAFSYMGLSVFSFLKLLSHSLALITRRCLRKAPNFLTYHEKQDLDGH